MTEQLKPCLCGAKLRWCGDDCDEPHACHLLVCDSCGLQINYSNPSVNDAETLEGCKAAMVDAWNSRPSPWVPVSDRLPDGTDRVLAYCTNANGVFIGFYNPGAFWAIYQGSAIDGNVTHWMPLPPAPETKGE